VTRCDTTCDMPACQQQKSTHGRVNSMNGPLNQRHLWLLQVKDVIRKKGGDQTVTVRGR